MTGRGHAIPLAILWPRVRSLLSSVRSQSGESGWRARRELQEGVVTVAVAHPPVVSEMYAAVAPLFVGSAASVFLPVVRAPPGFL